MGRDENNSIGLNSLSSAKRALVTKWLSALESKQMRPTIQRRASRMPIASPAQERLWFLHQWSEEVPAYNRAVALRLSGPLDARALRLSLDEVVRRHESLRTVFRDVDGRPQPQTLDPTPIEIQWCELTDLPATARWTQAVNLAKQAARRQFDLSSGPLLTALIAEIAPDEHLLLLATHHITFDAWSAKVLIREFAALYKSFSEGHPSNLGELPIQYSDFARWQREQLQGAALDRLLEYWGGRLQGPLPLLNLPADAPRPAIQSLSGAACPITLPAPLTRALAELGKRCDATPFMVMLAAFSTLLYRYTGQEDLVVGVPVSDRGPAETAELIGVFINTLPLRMDLSGNPWFIELLRRTREVCTSAYAHQDLPFEKLVEHLKPERAMGHTPLFQVMLNVENLPETPSDAMSLLIEEIELPPEVALVDLTLELVRKGETYTGSLIYRKDLFNEGTAGRMVGHLRTLLEGVTAHPEERLSRLPLLTPVEQHQLLVEWNDTKVDYPRDACIHHLFEAQVERTPEAVAVVYEDCKLTYRKLNVRANQLAHYLRRRGVGPEVLVGICMERSIEMVVGLLGILKAGGAYIPLDPEYPKERLAFMARDTAIRLLLMQSTLVGRLPTDIPEVLCLDTDGEKLTAESGQNLPGGAGAGNLAYVMYTSGSTGTPKGVEVVHRGVVRLVMNTTYARFDTDETFLQLAPLSFDASTFELWAPLVHGARCVVYPAGVPSPERLGEVIRQHHVSTLWLTASLFNVVIDEAPGALRGVSQLLIGGEQLSTPHVRRAQERLPGMQIINGYGPTESTTFTCCYAIPQGPATDTGLLSIGRPIANTRVYILDQEQNPVPVGIQGELYIGGDGLARGYLNRPELTAEMFIPDPFIAELGARLYRTGDLVRYRPDGNIEFLGRIDRQVKIRGFRIELEEIEAVLGRYPGIREAAVVAREDTPGDKRLAAYLVRKTEAAATATTVELRRFLQQKLPEYMIPSVFVFLETMPLTNSGKVDRRALPAPDQARPALGESYVAPRTPVEEALARIWSEVLGVERVGVHDNFFELGGHSLLAVRLFSRIVEQLGKKLPLATLFRAPTIDGLAAALEEDAARGKVSSLVEIQRTGCNPPLYVLHDLGGDVFFARHLPIYFGVDHPVYGLHAGPASGIVRGQGRLEELAAHYVEDLVASRPNGPYCLVGYSFGGFLAYEVARQLSSRGLRVGHLAIVDTGPSFRGRRSIAARLRGILHFLRNIRWWVQEDLLESRPGEMFQRLRRKVREVAKRLKRVTNSRGRCARGPDLEDIFDLRNLPEDYVRTMDYHLRLLREYQPRPYSGPLTLYRARTQRLFCLTESDLGWGRIVSGGIEVVQIPGNHDSIVKEPHVRLLAEALRGAIDRVAREPHGGLAGGGQTKTNPRTSE